MRNSVCYVILVVVILEFFSYALAQNPHNARQHIENIALSRIDLTPSKITVCSQYGCKKITNVSIDNKTWIDVTKRFNQTDVNPAYERALLAEYIADVEKIIGRKSNTSFDVAGTFKVYLPANHAKSDQMDCIDESTNTLVYLRLLEVENKINAHKVVGLVTRGGLIAGYPHTAVLIVDNTKDQKYVIDSWFYNNGRPAVVLPYKIWKTGWTPN